MSTEYTPQQIAAADQWIASLEVEAEAPLQHLRQLLAETGDPTKTYLAISRQIGHALQHGNLEYRARLAMSYVGLLFLLNRRIERGQ